MYSENGDYGQVRLFGMLPTDISQDIFMISSIGWHKCNDKYMIDRPKGTSLHTVLITVKGRGTLQIDRTEYSLTPGTVAFIPRNTACKYYTPKGGMWEFYWIHPNLGLTEQFLDTLALKGKYLTKFDAGYNYQQRSEELIDLCMTRPQNYEWSISGKLSELLHHMAICLCDTPEPLSLVDRATSYIEIYFSSDLTIDEIAKSLYVSTAHLIRAFKKDMGCTPHQYLTQYRLHFAVQLLELTQYRIEEIAEKAGFYSSSHFISCFKREYGVTPLQYRERSSET